MKINFETKVVVDNSAYFAVVEESRGIIFIFLEQKKIFSRVTLRDFANKILKVDFPEDIPIVLIFETKTLELKLNFLIKSIMSGLSEFSKFYKFLAENEIQVIIVDGTDKKTSKSMFSVISKIINLNRKIPKPIRAESRQAAKLKAFDLFTTKRKDGNK